jgi:hypothetical protein
MVGWKLVPQPAFLDMIPTTPTVPLMFCTKGEPSSYWQGLPVSTAAVLFKKSHYLMLQLKFISFLTYSLQRRSCKLDKTDPRRNLCSLIRMKLEWSAAWRWLNHRPVIMNILILKIKMNFNYF